MKGHQIPHQNRNEIVERQLKEILEPSQLRALRVDYLKELLKFPLDAFQSTFLINVGFKADEIDKLKARIAPNVTATESELRSA